MICRFKSQTPKLSSTSSYTFEQFGYLPLRIRDNGDLVEVVRLFFLYLKDKVDTSKYEIRNTSKTNDNNKDHDDGECSDEYSYEKNDDVKHTLIKRR